MKCSPLPYNIYGKTIDGKTIHISIRKAVDRLSKWPHWYPSNNTPAKTWHKTSEVFSYQSLEPNFWVSFFWILYFFHQYKKRFISTFTVYGESKIGDRFTWASTERHSHNHKTSYQSMFQLGSSGDPVGTPIMIGNWKIILNYLTPFSINR